MATKPKTGVKNLGGRPSTFSQATVDVICSRVSDGEPLAQVCREIGLPLATWYDWARDRPEVAVAIARAREAGFDMIALDTLRIADTQVEAIIEKSTANGIEITRQDALGHRKLQVETRLKLLAKWDPKRYGDKMQAEVHHTGAIDQLSDDQIEAKIAAAQARLRGADGGA